MRVTRAYHRSAGSDVIPVLKASPWVQLFTYLSRFKKVSEAPVLRAFVRRVLFRMRSLAYVPASELFGGDLLDTILSPTSCYWLILDIVPQRISEKTPQPVSTHFGITRRRPPYAFLIPLPPTHGSAEPVAQYRLKNFDHDYPRFSTPNLGLISHGLQVGS